MIDIEKIKKDKVECEKNILNLVKKFEKELPPQIKLDSAVVFHNLSDNLDCRIKLKMDEL